MAVVTKGKTFGATETVTNTKLHDLVDDATVTSIVNADISAGAAISATKLDLTASGYLTTGANFSITGIYTYTTAPVLPADTVKTADIQDDAVTTAKILDNNVTTAKILDNNVTSAKLEDDLAFGTFPTTPASAPDANYEVANKKYVDDNAGSTDYAIGDNLVISSDVETSGGNGTKKAVYLGKGGALRISFATYSSQSATARIYRNGSPVGTNRTCSGGYVTYSEDISGWSANDVCSVVCASDAHSPFVKEFRIYASVGTTLVTVDGT